MNLNYLVTGHAPGRLGNAHPNIVPYQVFAEPQLHARGMRLDLPHALAGTVPQTGLPLLFDGARSDAAVPPPLLGEHTVAVLRSRLGYDEARIRALARAGVVGVR